MATTSTPRLTALGVNRPSGEGLSAPAEPKRQSPLLSSPQEVDEGEKETTESGRPPLVRRRSVHVLHSSAFDQLLEVFQGNLDLLRVVAGRVGYNRIDALIKVNVLLFAGKGTLLGATAHAVRWELRASTTAMPFASGTFATRFVSAVSFVSVTCPTCKFSILSTPWPILTLDGIPYGRTYLKDLLGPVIESMLDCPGMAYEINPKSIAKSDNMGENRSALRTLVNRLVTRIVGSTSSLPQPLSILWYIVAVETSKRYPDATQDVVSSLVFGRFWGPAIACPQAYGICDERLPPTVSRGLILASKILQAMPCGKEFREEYMKCMDSFARSGAGRLAEYSAACTCAPKGPPTADLHALSSTQLPLRPWMRMMNSANPIDAQHLVSKLSTSDIEHLYSVLHACKDEIAASAGESADAVLSAFDLIGDPVENVTLPVDLSSSILRKLAKSQADVSVECVSNAKRYPETDIELASYTHASWDLIDRSYNPPMYTDTKVDGADPDIFVQPAVLMFNDIDTKVGVDRRSAEGNYKVVSGAPRNPVQRTGIRGRGKLQFWGPNHFGNPVITRWSRNANGKIHQRMGRPVAEVLCNKSANGTLTLLRAPLSVNSTLPDWVADFFRVNNDVSIQKERTDKTDMAPLQFGSNNRGSTALFDSSVELPDDTSATVVTATVTDLAGGGTPRASRSHTMSPSGAPIDESLHPLFTSGTLVYDGYVNDPLNTDNAWTESTSWHFHDENDVLKHNNAAITESEKMSWQVVDEDANWEPHAKDLLATVTERMNAHFRDRLLPLLCEIVSLIQAQGLGNTGIYRLSGSKKNIEAITELVYASATLPSAELAQISDLNELTGLVKSLLRDMVPPLIPYELYADAVKVATAESDRQSDLVSELLLKLPTSNFKVTCFLIQHLKNVASLALENRMGVSNLSVVFGPTIMRSPKGLSDDMKDQGSQCKFASILIETSPDFFDNVNALRSPCETLSLSFENIPDDGLATSACGIPVLQGLQPFVEKAAPPLVGHIVLERAEQPPSERASNIDDKVGSTDVTPTLPQRGVVTLEVADDAETDDESPETGDTATVEPPKSPRSKVQLPPGLDLSTLKDLTSTLVENTNVELPQERVHEDCRITDADDKHIYAEDIENDRRQSEGMYANMRSSDGGEVRLVTSPEGFECADVSESKMTEDLNNRLEDIASPDYAASTLALSPDEMGSSDAKVELSEDPESLEERGDCADCWAENVEGKYDEESDSFYCTRCWNVWATSADAGPVAQGEFIGEFDEDGLPIVSPTGPSEPLYDEDGLPIESDSGSTTRPSVTFDDDGLPLDINVDEYEPEEVHVAIPKPNRSRQRFRQLSAVAEEPQQSQDRRLGRSRKSRQASEDLKISSKSVETCREGVLWREVGTSWKKRYVAIHDSIIKIHKSAKASSTATEFFNITVGTRIGFEAGHRSFLLSFPERGYTLRLKANKASEASEWVRIVSNACRMAHSHA